MKPRPGLGLAELLVTLLLSALIAGALTTVLLTQLRLARIIAARVEAADAVRLALHAVPAELRLASPATDIRAHSPDSVAARLPRLSGVICARAADRIWIRTSGMRQPAARKDSVLFVSSQSEQVRALTFAAEDAQACTSAPGSTVYRLEVGDTAGLGSAVILFESGVYYLSGRALRYRLGGEGRQPLTEELFRDGESSFGIRLDSATASFNLHLATIPLAGREVLAQATVGFGFANLPYLP